MSAATITRGRIRRVQISAKSYRASDEELAAVNNPSFAARRYLRASIAWSDWEARFLSDMSDRPRWAGPLTEKQEAVMRSLCRRYLAEPV